MNLDNICIGCMKEKTSPGAVCPYCGLQISAYQVEPHHLEPFTILNGRYLLGKVLGEGGFGITYVALDLVKGQKVAIKELFVKNILRRENTKTVLIDSSVNGKAFYQECKAKFIQEATLLQTLGEKKGVVDIFEFFEENQTAYIVMEYLEGDDLGTYLKMRGGKIPFEETFMFLKPVMKSLIEIHAVGVYHRDISPDNIRYLLNHQVKIMDLGGAKFLHYSHNGNKSVQSHLVMVKKGYAPPEQYVPGYKIGPWMDVYAMGATIYRCITGIVPQESTGRVDKDNLVPPRKLGVDISPEIEKVLMKALALIPEERYTDMREFYQELKKAAGDVTVHIKPLPPTPNTGRNQKELPENDKEYTRLIEKLNNDKPTGNIGVIIIGSIVFAIIVGIVISLL